MLKGLKLKTKLPDKDSNTSSSQPSQPRHTEEENNASSKSNKRWQKNSDTQQPPLQKKPLLEEEKITEDDLIQTCESIWKSFMEGQIDNTQSLFKDLKRKEKKLYDGMREEEPAEPAHQPVVNFNILEDKDEDVFASVEKTALKNFDPRKSAYLITDIMAETVKNKGKSDESVYKLYKKKATKYDPENLIDEEYDTKQVEEQDEKKRKSKRDKKAEDKEKRREVMQKNKAQRVLANCRFCLSNNQIIEEQILSFSPNALLILPDIKKYEEDHFFIIPLEHSASIIELEEEQYDEVKNYMKCLVTMYDKMDYGVVFMETHIDIEKAPHCVIEVVATPREVHEELPMYFKKALSELESEWSTHKKIIDIKKEKGGIRKQIPKNFPYFYIDFDTAFGYAHVIEKTKDHNKNFAHEIIGSLLEIDKSMTMFPKKYERNELAKKKEAFQDKWSDYDWTQVL